MADSTLLAYGTNALILVMNELEISMTVIWVAIGLALCGAEVLTGTFVLLFFGLAAFVVAIARVLGLDNLTYEVTLFTIAGFASLLLFRNKIAATFSKPGRGFSNDADTVITLSDAVPARGEAKISYQGSMWTAMNESAITLAKGDKAVIYKTEGVRIFVRALS
ncbi:MAG: NfeD family protein [Bdellovibrionaceae bacterium]|nr:NfeD family protein [Pseudobdellovibrionaceae bacterium]